ncbi:peptidoglycan-binding domain-containing protein [Celeribacter halophilus]|uniref:Peptidoglycan-binding domain-containing protein n=1 Tax=Celeribacter halophilus TaxID=576117 RepID=A0AAW7XRD6_9RHOB|nr:peptidoglycan-binding domain-containing protein [Celeribacter halophilus]MDO6456256.1 peptidoglycan-binding domain-containing protein [Celeribacter halophilus]
MARRFATASLRYILMTLVLGGGVPTMAEAQNLIVNGDFESPVVPNYGDNLLVLPAPWLASYDMNGTMPASLVRVDGPNGATSTAAPNLYGGDALIQALPQTDASNTPEGQYMRWFGTPQFGQSIHMEQDGCIKFGADFATANAQLVPSLSLLPMVQMMIHEFTPSDLEASQSTIPNNSNAYGPAHNWAQNWIATDGRWHAQAIWMTVEANKTYLFSAISQHGVAMDNMSAEFVPEEQCVAGWTPPIPTLEANDISLTKSCTPASSYEHNGQVGQVWECSVDVTVPSAPFAGTLNVTDLYTPISTTASEVVSATSSSGGFDCTAGATCIIDGADFDASGSDTLDFAIFVTSTELQDSYPMQNCVEGSYDDGTGVVSPIAGNCVDAQWIPRSSIDKSCDPLEADASGSMTMNCQIEVTGTDLATGSYIFAADMFGALPPMTTTIAGTMMNVTSTEPWSCVDQNINNPGSTGLCELTAADMLAAGGASTINVSFDFTASESEGQVVNCPMTDILPASFIGAAGQRSAAPDVDAPQTDTIAGLPDNCVVLDLPVSPKPPEFALKKACRLGGVQDGNAFYACTIYISQTSGAPITDPLTFDELFSTTSGSPATQYMLNMQGTPAMPNGWGCQQPPYTNGASCTIAAVDFNTNPSHRIDAYLSIPVSEFGDEGFQNCAQVRIGDQVVGAAECVEVEQPPVETVFDVTKQCKEAGPRQTFGSSVWFQPYQCTLTVATNAPFTGPLWLSEALSFGQNSGAGSILNITSADPWICSTPPYAPAGQGTTPECSIDGAQFPASGSSTLTVDLMLNGAMDLFGAENCVSIGLGKEVGEGEPLASDCFEIAPPPAPEPSLDITKTCDPAVLGSDGIWTAECEINVHFENFDTTTNRQFYIYDELGGNGPQTPLTSLMPFNAMGAGGWGPSTGTPAGFNNATGMLLNYLQADGSATITQPYTATFSGPAGQLINGGPITNCAWVTIPTLSMRAPEGPVGDEKVCTPITFPISAVGNTGVILDPAVPDTPEPDTPVGPVIATGSVGSTRPIIDIVRPETPTPVPAVPRPILTIGKEQTGSCDPDRISQTYDCGFRLRVTNTGDGAYLGPLVLTDTSGAPGMVAAQVVSGNGWTCGAVVNAALSCSNPALNLAPGASTYIDLRMTVSALRKGGSFQNCAAVGVPANRTERVALIQKLMNDRGLNAGPVDGKPGQKTYTALSKLRSDLGLPDSREFDDALFEALGLPLQDKGASSCVTATLPAMPAPPLRCDAVSTVKQGETCACRYDNMFASSATSCQCVKGYELVSGKGCVEVIADTPAPAPTPAPTPALQCDLRSTYERGDICACIDHENAKNISATQCGCTNGLPMINGKCLPIAIKPSTPVDNVDGTETCKIKLNGICIK